MTHYRKYREYYRKKAEKRYQTQKFKILSLARRRYHKSPEIYCKRALVWRKANWARFLKNERIRYLRQMRRPEFVIMKRLRSRIRGALKCAGTKKISKTTLLLGCSLQEFRRHIENQFTSGMSWKNRHLWHIDHIIPVAHFDLEDPLQQQQCFHFSNLRPLWAHDNLIRQK